MCQQALQLLKAAVRTQGEHKQKIVIRINMDGITLIDASNNVSIASGSNRKVNSLLAVTTTDCWEAFSHERQSHIIPTARCRYMSHRAHTFCGL